jgi:hypothetical protein
VANLSVDIDDSAAIWVTGTDRRMTRITDSTYSPGVQEQPTVVSFAALGDLWMFALANRRFVGITFRDSATLVFLDTTGAVRSTVDIPFPGTDDIAPAQRRRAMQGAALCVGKGGTLIAMTYNKEARIEFYSTTGHHIGSAEVPFPYEARFDSTARPQRGGALARFNAAPPGPAFVEGRLNYASCAFSEQHLFALYSGGSDADDPSGEVECCGTSIHVFDLAGRLVRILDLGVTLTSIAVSPSGRRIFGSSSWSESAIYGFTVPPRGP